MKKLINVVISAWTIAVMVAAAIIALALLAINKSSYYAYQWVNKEGLGICYMICRRLNLPEP